MADGKWVDRTIDDDEKHDDDDDDNHDNSPESEAEEQPAGDPMVMTVFKDETDAFGSLPESPGDLDDRKPAARPTLDDPNNGNDDDDGGDDDSQSDEDQKLAARPTIKHPYDDQILIDADNIFGYESKRARVARTPSHDNSDDDQLALSLNFDATSPSATPYHPGMYEHQATASPTYGYVHHATAPYPAAHMAQAHAAPPYASHHQYYQHHAHMMQQPPHAHYAPAAPARSYEHVQQPVQQPVEHSSTRTSSGEHSSQFNRGPSHEELENARTTRARTALDTWYKRLEDLYRYRVQKGDCKVPQKYPPNRELGIWVNKQRMEKKSFDERGKTSMTQHKIDALTAIGFEWAKQKGDVSWNDKFLELLEYKQLHGDCSVPTKYPENPALGRWVSTQRSNYKDMLDNGDRKRMTAKKEASLEKIGFQWRMMNN